MSDRSQRLVELLGAEEIDLLLVTALVNVRYLTGYSGSNGLALVGPHTRVFVTDFRYVEQAATEIESSYDRRRDHGDLLDSIAPALPGDGTIRLGFDDANVTVRAARSAARAAARTRRARRRRWPRGAIARGQGSPGDRADAGGGRSR